MSKEVFLNLGCGFRKKKGCINVDAFDICEPDIVHDLNVFPYPWADDSIDGIIMWHVLEHLDDWWGAFLECARILKPGARLSIHVPDESSSSAITYRDHNHVFCVWTFRGITGDQPYGQNAWAAIEHETVPLKMISFRRVPFKKYNWMMRWGFRWLLKLCADHMRNFIHEQRFMFIKIGDRDE